MNRNSVLINNIAGSLVLKGLAMVVSFVTTSAYLGYFNNNAVLGSWFTITSILNWILVFDIGIGNGLRNKLVQARDHIQKKILISSAYALLGIICLVIAAGGLVLVLALDWNSILGVSQELVSPNVLKLCVCIVLVGIIIQFWLKLIVSILYSEQKTALANSLTLVTSVCLLAFVLLFRTEDVEVKLIALSIAQVLFINLPIVVASIACFSSFLKEAIPSIRCVSASSAKSVIGLGTAFFVIQICLLVANSTNEMLIGMIFSSEDVVDYQIYYRLFFTVVSIFTVIVQPMWSALALANEDKNYVWMKSVYRKYNLISLAGTVLTMLILASIDPIIRLWIGEGRITVSPLDAGTLAIWACITMFINSSTCVANATNRLKCQLVFCFLAAILKVPVSFGLSTVVESWSAVVIANCIVLLPLLVAQFIDINRFFAVRVKRYEGVSKTSDC